MGLLIGLVTLVLDIIAILDVIKSSMDKEKKLLWVALILVLPIIGMIFYFVIGKKR